MKAILKFDLSDSDQLDKFHLACRAGDYQRFIWEFQEEILRKYYKYGIPEGINDAESLLDNIREKFYEMKTVFNIQEPS